MAAYPNRRPALAAGGVVLAGALALAVVPRASVGKVELTPMSSAPSADSTYTPLDEAGQALVALPPVAPHVPPASADGLVLHGVLGGVGDEAAAIIARPDGSQLLARVGRAILPGVVLRGVDRTGALLMVGDRPMRLGLIDGAGRSSLTTADGSAQGASTSGNAGAYRPRDARAETIEFRLGLSPRVQDGRITGFTIKPDAKMPIFEQAGLRPGDVVTGMNGRGILAESDIDGIARETRLSNTMVFQIERDGQRKEVRVDVAR